jgi:acetyl-CoA acetyltransferase
VYFGCANQAGEDNRNVARMAALLAGLPVSVAAVTFNRLCASSLAAVNAAARAIKVDEGDVYIAGGVESMTRSPYAIPKTSPEWNFANLTAWDTIIGWRFPNQKLKDKHGNGRWANGWEYLRLTKPSREQDQIAGKPAARGGD